MRRLAAGLILLFVNFIVANGSAAEPRLIGHWPLRGSSQDRIGINQKESARDIDFTAAGPQGEPNTAAHFNGTSSVIEVPDAEALRLGTDEFSIALRVNTVAKTDDLPGDLLSQFDSQSRTGFHLGIYSHFGVTNSQPNSRQLHFGMDQGRLEPKFTDHGRLGTAVLVFALCVHNAHLYAATCHAGTEESGHIFRYEAADRWIDLGSPDKANSISAMAVYNGELYVASSKYRLAGSSLAESQNPHSGGKVFKLGADDCWVPCGALSQETEAVAGMIVFQGKLYAGSLYKPAGFFRYEGGEEWTALPTPEGKRVEALAVHNGAIYATSYDEAAIFRFDGDQWHRAGTIPEATQTYGFAVHRGDLYVSEWPKARVFRSIRGGEWTDVGKLGSELEAMPLLVYNGKMYGGTLPTAEVYRYDGDGDWKKIQQVDTTPDVKYRRAWSMAVFHGRLFVGTLPSGRVLSIEAGRNATYDRELPAGWNHIVAVRHPDRLQLYVNGEPVAESATFVAGDYNLTNRQPLQIGFGAQDYFRGDLADVRLYRGALSAEQARELSRSR